MLSFPLLVVSCLSLVIVVVVCHLSLVVSCLLFVVSFCLSVSAVGGVNKEEKESRNNLQMVVLIVALGL